LNDLLPYDTETNYKLTAEIGRTGLRKYSGYVDEEFDPNLRGIRGMRKFDEMRRNDPDIGAVLLAIEMSLHSVEWATEAAGKTQADIDAQEFLNSCMEDMSESWHDFLSDVFSMFPFGFSLFEIVYKIRSGPKKLRLNDPNAPASSRFDDGRIGWKKLSIRNQETIERWAFDEHGSLVGAWQQLSFGNAKRVFIPIEKCLLFTTKRERGNPEGYSILRNAYRQYYHKSNLEEIEAISAERDMTGVPFIRLPVGATEDDRNAALNILEKLKWDDQVGLALPRMGPEEHQWWEFGIVQSAGAPRINIHEVINRTANAIARSTLSQFLMLGSSGVGSYALSSDHQDLFHIAAKGYLDRLEETFNRFAVQKLFDVNEFEGVDKLPKVRHGRIGKRQLDTFVASLEKLMAMGMPVQNSDWNIFRREVELPELSDDELEELEEEEEELTRKAPPRPSENTKPTPPRSEDPKE